MTNVKAIVKPDLLVWARENSGFSIDDAAKKANIRPEKLANWEKGITMPTMTQLRNLAKVYKRPLAIFYLAAPPKTFDVMRDFRRLPDKVQRKESTQLKLERRLAIYRRAVALDLYGMLGEEIPKFTGNASINEDAENTADKIRELAGIRYEDQTAWKDERVAFNTWRSALEKLGILIFQARKIELNEMRGFSISETPLPVIVINGKDNPQARTFTMIHEFVHLILKDSGLCNDLEDDNHNHTHDSDVEVFCNRVAGAVLVPKQKLIEEDIVKKRQIKLEWNDKEINKLASRYRVSREVILRRLLIVNLTTEAFYRKKREDFKKENDAIIKKKAMEEKKGGFAEPYIISLSNAGVHFTSLVMDSYHSEKITTSDLSDYLNIKLNHLPEIEIEMGGKTHR